MPEDKESKIDTVANILRTDIKSGTYGTNGRLPSIAQLVKTHQVSRATIYEVLRLLQSEGIIISRDNSYIVFIPQMRLPGAPLFDRYLLKQGLEPTVDNITLEVVPMPADIAEIFGQKIAEGIHVVHRVRRHGTMGVPLRLAENWYPFDLAGQFLEDMRQDPNLNVAGRIRETHGVAIATRHDDIFARLPTPQEISLLNLIRTSPVQEIRRQFLTKDGRVVFLNRTILVAAYFVLSYDSDHLKDKEKEQQPPSFLS